MKVALIVAMDRERGIGRDNDLMWHLPDDMQFFKDTTKGQIVVMGRRNYDSIPEKYRPLPGRENVVLTRNADYLAEGCAVFTSLDACLSAYAEENERRVFIIGGGEIYRLALEANAVDEMYITHINHVYGADTFFPHFQLEDWTVETIQSHPADERHNAAFTILKYTKR
ncbi:MAG: dihydrofolate reductase [Bacteroidetes bacterium RIFCSPHIGHO2_02_FULL_44_7]|nr:MAG: dihydrofolate reductase [Bacteroidetes bacterium RIFCSPHIGHO2_02_FULL_44_7]